MMTKRMNFMAKKVDFSCE